MDRVTISKSPEPQLIFQKLHDEATPPARAYDRDVGYDLYACIPSETRGRGNFMDLPPNLVRPVPTKLIVTCTGNFHLEVCSRSGLAKNNHIFVANSPGIIDPGYRGELVVLLLNAGKTVQRISHRQKIAQLLIRPTVYLPTVLSETLSLEETERGAKAYGSSDR